MEEEEDIVVEVVLKQIGNWSMSQRKLEMSYKIWIFLLDRLCGDLKEEYCVSSAQQGADRLHVILSRIIYPLNKQWQTIIVS